VVRTIVSVGLMAALPTVSEATSDASPMEWSGEGWYGFSNSSAQDRDPELRERCSPTFKRVHVASGITFDALCDSIGMRCKTVCDWEGNAKSCSDGATNRPGSGARLGYCVYR
jgi:hypothetical protein